MNTIRKTDLRLPCSWNECNIGLSVWVVTNYYRN